MARLVKNFLRKVLSHQFEDVIGGFDEADIHAHISETDGWTPEEVHIEGPLTIKPDIIRPKIRFETPGALELAEGSSVEQLRLKLPRWVRQVLLEHLWPSDQEDGGSQAASSGEEDSVSSASRRILQRLRPPEPLQLPTVSSSLWSNWSQSLGASWSTNWLSPSNPSPPFDATSAQAASTPMDDPVLVELHGLELYLRTFSADERLELRADCAEQVLIAWLRRALSEDGVADSAGPSNPKDSRGRGDPPGRAGFSSRLTARLDALIRKIRANLKVSIVNPVLHLTNVSTGLTIDFKASRADFLAVLRPTSSVIAETWFSPGDAPEPPPGSNTMEVVFEDLVASYHVYDTEGGQGQLEIKVPEFGIIAVMPPEAAANPDGLICSPYSSISGFLRDCPSPNFGPALRFTAYRGGTISLVGGGYGLHGLFDMINELVEAIVAEDALTIASDPLDLPPSLYHNCKDFAELWWRHCKEQQHGFESLDEDNDLPQTACCEGRRLQCMSDREMAPSAADALTAEEHSLLRALLTVLPLPNMLLLLGQSSISLSDENGDGRNFDTLLRQTLCCDVHAMWPVSVFQVAVECDRLSLQLRDQHAIDLDGTGPPLAQEVAMDTAAFYFTAVPFPQRYTQTVRFVASGIIMSDHEGRRSRDLIRCCPDVVSGLRRRSGVLAFQTLAYGAVGATSRAGSAPCVSVEVSSGCFGESGKGGPLPWELDELQVQTGNTRKADAMVEELVPREKGLEINSTLIGMSKFLNQVGVRIWSCIHRSCRHAIPYTVIPPRLLFVKIDIDHKLEMQAWPSAIPGLLSLSQQLAADNLQVHAADKFVDALYPLVPACGSIQSRTTQVKCAMEDSQGSGVRLAVRCLTGIKFQFLPMGILDEAHEQCRNFSCSLSCGGIEADCTTSSGEKRTVGRCMEESNIQCTSSRTHEVRTTNLLVRVVDSKFRVDVSPQLNAVLTHFQSDMEMQASFISAEMADARMHPANSPAPLRAQGRHGTMLLKQTTGYATSEGIIEDVAPGLTYGSNHGATPIARHSLMACLQVESLTVNIADGISPLLRLSFSNVTKVQLDTQEPHSGKGLLACDVYTRFLGIVGEFSSDNEGLWEPFLEPWAFGVLVRYEVDKGAKIIVSDAVEPSTAADFPVEEVDDNVRMKYGGPDAKRSLLINCATPLVKHVLYVSEEFNRMSQDKTKLLRSISGASSSEAIYSPLSCSSSVSPSFAPDHRLDYPPSLNQRPSSHGAAVAAGGTSAQIEPDLSRISALNLSGHDIDAWFFRGPTLQSARHDATAPFSTEGRSPCCTLAGQRKSEGSLEPLDNHVSVPASTALVLCIHEKTRGKLFRSAGSCEQVGSTSTGRRRHATLRGSPYMTPSRRRLSSMGPATMSRALSNFGRRDSPAATSGLFRRDKRSVTATSANSSVRNRFLEAKLHNKVCHFRRMGKPGSSEDHRQISLAALGTDQQTDVVNSQAVGLKFFTQKQEWPRRDDRPAIPLTPGWCVAMKDGADWRDEIQSSQDGRGGWQRDELIVQMLMPHPSRRLLLIGSPVRIFNYTDINLEVGFETWSAEDIREVYEFQASLCKSATGPAYLLGDRQPIRTEHLVLPPASRISGIIPGENSSHAGSMEDSNTDEVQKIWSLPSGHFCGVPVPAEFRDPMAGSDFGFRLVYPGTQFLRVPSARDSGGVAACTRPERGGGGGGGQTVWLSALKDREEAWIWTEVPDAENIPYHFRVKAVKEIVEKPYLVEVLNIIILPAVTVTNVTPAPLRVQMSEEKSNRFTMPQTMMVPEDRELAPGEAAHVYRMSSQQELSLRLRIEEHQDARTPSRWSRPFRIDPMKASRPVMEKLEIPFGTETACPVLEVTLKEFVAVITCPFWMTNNSSLPIVACRGELPFPTIHGVTLMHSSPTDVKLSLDVNSLNLEVDDGDVPEHRISGTTDLTTTSQTTPTADNGRSRLGRGMSQGDFQDVEKMASNQKESPLAVTKKFSGNTVDDDDVSWGKNLSTRSPGKNIVSKGGQALREIVVQGPKNLVALEHLRCTMPCPVTSRAERGYFHVRHPEERTFEFAVLRDPLPCFFGDHAAPSTCFHIVPPVIITNKTSLSMLVKTHSRGGKPIELEPDKRIPHWTNKRDTTSLQIQVRPSGLRIEADGDSSDTSLWSGDIAYGEGHTGRYAMALVLDEGKSIGRALLTVEISDASEGILSLSLSEQPCLVVGCWARGVHDIIVETDRPPGRGAKKSDAGHAGLVGKIRGSANGIGTAIASALGQEAKASIGQSMRRVENAMSLGGREVKKKMRFGFDAGTQAAKRVGDAANFDSTRIAGAARDMARRCKEEAVQRGRGLVGSQQRRTMSPTATDGAEMDRLDSDGQQRPFAFRCRWGWPLKVGWYQPFESPPTMYITIRWKEYGEEVQPRHVTSSLLRWSATKSFGVGTASHSMSLSVAAVPSSPHPMSQAVSTRTSESGVSHMLTQDDLAFGEARSDVMSTESPTASRDGGFTQAGRRVAGHNVKLDQGEYDEYDLYGVTSKIAVHLGRTTPLVVLQPVRMQDVGHKKQMAVIIRIRPQAKSDLEAHSHDVRRGAYGRMHMTTADAQGCAKQWARLSAGSPDLVEITEVGLDRLGEMEVEWVCARCSRLMEGLQPETCSRCQAQFGVLEHQELSHSSSSLRRLSQGSYMTHESSGFIDPRGFEERKMEVLVNLSSIAVSVVSQGGSARPQEFLFGQLTNISVEAWQWRGQESGNVSVQDFRLDCQPRVMHERLKQEVGGRGCCAAAQPGYEDSAAHQLVLETPYMLASVGPPHEKARLNAIRQHFPQLPESELEDRPCLQIVWDRPLASVAGKVIFKRFKIFSDQRWELIFDHFAASSLIMLYQEMLSVVSQSGTDYTSRTNATFMDSLGRARQHHTFIRDFEPPHAAPIVQVEEAVISGLEVAIWGSLMLSRLPSNAMPPSLAFLLKVLSFSDVLYVHGSTMVLEDWVTDSVKVTATQALAEAQRQYKGRILLFLGRIFGSSNILLLPKLLLNPFSIAQKATAAAADMIDVINLAHLTFDDQYIKTQRGRRKQPRNVDSLQSGVRDAGGHLAGGLYAVTDVVVKPREHYRQQGLWGVPRGICVGFLSCLVKPIDGGCQALRAMLQGVSAAMKGRIMGRKKHTRHGSSTQLTPTAQSSGFSGDVDNRLDSGEISPNAPDSSMAFDPSGPQVTQGSENFGMQSVKCVDEPTLRGAPCLRLPRLLFGESGAIVPFAKWHAQLLSGLGPHLVQGLCSAWHLSGHPHDRVYVVLCATHSGMLLVDLNRNTRGRGNRELLRVSPSYRRKAVVKKEQVVGAKHEIAQLMSMDDLRRGKGLFRCCRRRARDLEAERHRLVEKHKVLGNWGWKELKNVDIFVQHIARGSHGEDTLPSDAGDDDKETDSHGLISPRSESNDALSAQGRKSPRVTLTSMQTSKWLSAQTSPPSQIGGSTMSAAANALLLQSECDVNEFQHVFCVEETNGTVTGWPLLGMHTEEGLYTACQDANRAITEFQPFSSSPSTAPQGP